MTYSTGRSKVQDAAEFIKIIGDYIPAQATIFRFDISMITEMGDNNIKKPGKRSRYRMPQPWKKSGRMQHNHVRSVGWVMKIFN